MSAAAGSGPNDPGDRGGINAHVTVSSGPHQPGDPGPKTHSAPDGTPPLTTQSVSLKVAVHEPHPFSVYLTTPDSTRVKLISVKIHVSDGERHVSDAEVLATDRDLTQGQTAEFPITKEHLETMLPRLQVGKHVEVDVVFAAPPGAALQISVVGKGHHSSKLGEFVERLTHGAGA